MHGNITASTFGTGPTALDSAQLNLVNEGEMPPLPTGLQPKKSFYKRAKQRVQESFRRHNGSKKIPLVKSYSSQPTDGSVASDYELLNRSLPMPRKVLSGSISPNTRSLDYKKLSSVRPVVNGGNDSWIKNCFIPSGIQTDQNDRTSSYEKTTLTDVPFAYKGKKVRNKKLRTKKWYNNLLSRIVDRSTTDNKMKKKKAKSIDTTDNRLAQLLPRKFRFNKRREINVIAKSEGLQVNEVDSQAFRPSAHHRVTKGIADLSAEAQTGLQSVTKQISRETKILHRTSGDFHHLGAASAEIYIQSPSSPSSKDSSIALLQLDTSRVKYKNQSG